MGHPRLLFRDKQTQTDIAALRIKHIPLDSSVSQDKQGAFLLFIDYPKTTCYATNVLIISKFLGV